MKESQKRGETNIFNVVSSAPSNKVSGNVAKESQRNKISTVPGRKSKTIKSPSDTTIYALALKQNLVRK